MADDDAGQVNTFFGKDPLLLQTVTRLHDRVGGDRHARLAMGPGHRPEDAFDIGRHAGAVRRRLDDTRLHPTARDALGDVTDEHVGEDVLDLAIDLARRMPVQEEEGEVVVGIDAGGHNQVDIDLVVDPSHRIDVAAVSQRGAIDDGVDAVVLHFAQCLDHRADHAILATSPAEIRVLLLDLRA